MVHLPFALKRQQEVNPDLDQSAGETSVRAGQSETRLPSGESCRMRHRPDKKQTSGVKTLCVPGAGGKVGRAGLWLLSLYIML